MLRTHVVPVIVCFAVTLAMWFALQKIHPIYSTAAIEAEGREKGGMSAEMIEAYRSLDLKNNCFTFGIWGAVLAGLSGLLTNPTATARVRGGLVGVVLGIGAGMLGAYLGHMQEARTDYQGASASYWIMRWTALTGPMVFASTAACATSGSLSRPLGDCFAGGLIGLVLGVLAITLLHGVATPLEKPENIFPAWTANRILGMFSVNVAVFCLLLAMSSRSGKVTNAPVDSVIS